MHKTWVQSLDQEGPPEKWMATHSSIFLLEHPMIRGAWQAIVHEVIGVGYNLATNLFIFIDIMHKMTLAYLAYVAKTMIDK